MKTCDACGSPYGSQDTPSVHILYNLEPWIVRSLELCPSCSEEVLRTVTVTMQLKEENHGKPM